MSLTRDQLISLGFKPGKKKTGFARQYDTLVFPLNKSDYLYINKNGNMVWMCFTDLHKHRINYQVINIGITGYHEMAEYLQRTIRNYQHKEEFLVNGETNQEDSESIS